MSWARCFLCEEEGAASRQKVDGKMRWVHLSCWANQPSAPEGGGQQ